MAKKRASRTFALVVLLVTLANADALNAVPLPPPRRVNTPYFSGGIPFERTAIFWFGKVSPTENYADVRIGYNSAELFVHVTIFDRRLWYDESPTAATLADWDAVVLYLDRDGNVGSAPDATSYRFDGQVNWWEDRAGWQAAFQGGGGRWNSVSIPFTSMTGFRWESATVGGFNNNQNNRGWTIEYHIPFASLGLLGAPPQGTTWGLGVVLHDRDVDNGPLNSDKVWPESMLPNSPATWGQLYFGTPTYTPTPAVPQGFSVIRHKLNGAVVPDSAVGGTVGNLCPGDPDFIWNQWANFKDPSSMQFNVQNQGDISDWPCFAKYFVTFPLGALPAGKIIISATLTLHQFGNAGQGWNPPPQPSYLQVLTIGQEWSEDMLTWNTAPLARENVGGAWVDPLLAYGGDPGIPRAWDVSRAVAEAYSAGEPVRLAVYSADGDYHSGRYFWSSNHDDWHPEARPTLMVGWGEPLAAVQQAAWPLTVQTQQTITYTLSLLGSGRTLTLTDDLPVDVSAPAAIQVQGGGAASFDQALRRLTWNGVPAPGLPVTITFPVTVLTSSSTAIVNRAVLTDVLPFTSTASTIVLANPRQIWLPLLTK